MLVSNWITLVINLVGSFKTNSHIAEPIKAPSLSSSVSFPMTFIDSVQKISYLTFYWQLPYMTILPFILFLNTSLLATFFQQYPPN